MRLINVLNMRMKEFFDADRPPYAILSHTWDDEEVTYRDFVDLATAERKAGWPKIENAVRLTQDHGLKYLWIDTCCIDKTSSAELQEAINSMYRWYEDAFVCFAFLSDVLWQNLDAGARVQNATNELLRGHASDLGTNKPNDQDATAELLPYSLTESRWFTRGWTLQELIAPHTIRFFDKHYRFIGLKDELSRDIMLKTGIDEAILHKRAAVSGVSVAQRMSWAAGRKTSRVEDRAYSLLGIFEVSMPMIYGEGEKAFIRLQEEIIRASDDNSIFAWETIPADKPHSGALLAASPDDFAQAGDIVLGGQPQPFELTNAGLRIELPLRKAFTIKQTRDEEFAALLNCHYKGDTTGTLALRLTQPETSEQFHPVVGRKWNLLAFDVSRQLRKNSRLAFISSSNIAICERRRLQITRTLRHFDGVMFKLSLVTGLGPPCSARPVKAYPSTGWDAQCRNFRTTPYDRIRAGVVWECSSGAKLAVVFGYDREAIYGEEWKRPNIWAHHYHPDLAHFAQFCESHSAARFPERQGAAYSIFDFRPRIFTENFRAEARAFDEAEIIKCGISDAGSDAFDVEVEIAKLCELDAVLTERQPTHLSASTHVEPDPTVEWPGFSPSRSDSSFDFDQLDDSDYPGFNFEQTDYSTLAIHPAFTDDEVEAFRQVARYCARR